MESSVGVEPQVNKSNEDKVNVNSGDNKTVIDLETVNNKPKIFNKNNLPQTRKQQNDNNLIEAKTRTSLRQQLPKKLSGREVFISTELQKDFEISKLRKENQRLRKLCEQSRKENHLLRQQLIKNGLNSEIIIESDLDLIYDDLLNQKVFNNDIRSNIALNNGKTFVDNNNQLNLNNEQSISNKLNDNEGESFTFNSGDEKPEDIVFNENNNNFKLNNSSDELKKVRRKIHSCSWPACERKFANKYHLQRHELTHSGEKPCKCDFKGCDYATRDEYSLGIHRRQHTGERPFKCTYPGCKFRAAQSGNLMSHVLKHTGEMPFKCDWPGCDQAFRFRSTYVYHKKVHINDKSFVCSFGCGKSFIYRNDLKNHEAIHTGERKYKCSWPGCDKSYIQKNGLNNHLKWHTGDRRFACDWPGCEWKSLSAHGLVKHKKTHTGERPFPCDRCDRKFADESNLRAHQRVVHDKERRFVCTFVNCNKSFTVRRLLLEHQQKEKHQ